jgi:putative ABC transport system permease protein
VRLTDLLLFPLAALSQQKGRTALTTLGVVFGAFVLAASLSINHGVQETIVRESNRTDALRRINVYPRWGNDINSAEEAEVVIEGSMSEEKRQRLRAALTAQRNGGQVAKTMVLLSPETLQRLAALEHVQRIEPRVEFQDVVRVNGQTHQVRTESAAPQDPAYLQRIVAGRFFEAPDEPTAVVSEFLLYRCGIANDEDVEAVLGQKIKIEIHSHQRPAQERLRVYLFRPDGRASTPAEVELIANLNQRLPAFIKQLDLTAAEIEILGRAMEERSLETESEASVSGEFTIVGVMRQVTAQELNDRRWWDYLGGTSDVLLPYQTAADFYFTSPSGRGGGLHQTLLITDSEEHVKEVVKRVRDLGLQADAPIEFIEREQFTWRLVFGGMTCVAAVALLVAAMGITNTMLMSVLERTREIGIMKSVGAAAIHIQTIFLIEGIVIGAVGGILGLLLAVAASFPGDTWVRSMVERDMNLKLKDALFVFPAWLVVTVVLFAVIVTTAAALYPARRAARIDPVMALRHE